MRINFTFISFILAIFSFTACNTSKELPKLNSKDIVYSLQKGSCLGKCAVYSLKVYNNKYVTYEGVAGGNKIGLYYKMISDSVYNDLVLIFSEANFFEFEDEYISDIADFPQIIIGQQKDKIYKKVKYKENRPKNLYNIQLKLEEIANSFEWKPYGKIKNKVHETVEVRADDTQEINIFSEIIIEPNENVMLQRWFKRYDGYGVYLIKKISPNLNYWLISYNQDLIKPEEMLLIIQQDRDIKKAEFNKRIVPREH